MAKRTLAQLQELDKDQLITLIQHNFSSSNTKLEKKSKSVKRAIDFGDYECKKVALRICYNGRGYKGIASSQGFPLRADNFDLGQIKDVTVEDALFNAIFKTKLHYCIGKGEYSRCGRTDTGVSAASQIISLHLRGVKKKNKENISDENLGVKNIENISDDRVGVDDECLPYDAMINSALPDDIRVLGWSFVKDDFDARHACQWRQYRYFFTSAQNTNCATLNIAAMRDAARRFLGTHDFRNLCCTDQSKGKRGIDYSTLRTIIDAQIIPAQLALSNESNEPSEAFIFLWQFVIKGSSFLYHQVRCMMGALFLIGKGTHDPAWIDHLLSVKQCPHKPPYELANEIPLVLEDAGYPEGTFQWRVSGPERLHQNLHHQLGLHASQALLYKYALLK